MSKLIVAFCLCFMVAGISGVFWDDLRITWGPVPGEGFFTKMPRLVSDAVADGWVGISTSCENNGNYSGFRYKQPDDDYINVIFDKNGIIAGIQVVLPHEDVLAPKNPFRYDLVPMFQNETVNGKPHFVLTAYFVPPESICSTGRTVFDLLEQGTGSGLWFQNGASPNAQIDVPLMRQDATALGWTACECFNSMGLHNFFQVDTWQANNCSTVQPTQALYNLNEEMTGFVFQALGPTNSTRFETPPNEALYAIIGSSRVPQCILDANTLFGVSTIHIYFIEQPYLITCN